MENRFYSCCFYLFDLLIESTFNERIKTNNRRRFHLLTTGFRNYFRYRTRKRRTEFSQNWRCDSNIFWGVFSDAKSYSKADLKFQERMAWAVIARNEAISSIYKNSYNHLNSFPYICSLFKILMIQSMTGFGKATMQLPNKKITVEVKSLNSKGLDLNVRIPSVYREMELGLRNQLSTVLERGKVDFSIFMENTAEQTSAKVNVPIVKAYIAQLREVYADTDVTELMKMAVRMPDAMKTEREEIDENDWNLIQKVIDEALENMQSFRVSEGSALEKEFLQRIANIMTLMNATVALDGERIETVKTRLRTAIDELKVNIDDNRFEQELIFYLEKYDITEEKVRLENHLNYFIETMAGKEANGRKLGFITQEIGREINTMGSKSNHAQMQKLVVQMKDELEKIKEQVLNVL